VQRLVSSPLAPLLAFSIALAAILTVSLIAGVSLSETSGLIVAFCWSLLVAFWVLADARRRGCVLCFDFGLYCYLFLPCVVPWYCFWSRGWRGALTLSAIVSLWLAPYIIATVVWQVLYG
jgi:hypothetical protein